MKTKIKTTMEMNKKFFVLVCLLCTNILIVSSQGLYRQSQNHQAGSEKLTSAKEELSGFLFESKSALTTKPDDLPEDVGLPVGDGYLILLAFAGIYIAYSIKFSLRRPARRSISLRRVKSKVPALQSLRDSSLRRRSLKQSSLLIMIYGLLPASIPRSRNDGKAGALQSLSEPGFL